MKKSFNPLQTNVEKLARKAVNPDTDAVFVTMDEKNTDAVLQREQTEKFNQSVGDLQERLQKHMDQITEASQAIAADLEHIEIMPLGSYALIQPFSVNPFQKITVKKSGLITDLGGLTPTYKSNETGQVEEEQPYVKVGIVAETGMDCKFLKPGDIVYYNVASEVMVPFFKFGFVVVAEQRVIAVVNEKLTERKSALKSE